mmetsp:Transcript_27234/g.65210  ORF Transcript_27234/g.65210 Transcript_27234/m.65210 type:complete len:324 (-) Transcript_27234:319-1290(-)
MPTNETPSSSSASASAAMPTDTSISKGTILTTATTGTKSTNNDDDEKSLGAVAEDGNVNVNGGGDDADGDDGEEDADSIGVVAPPLGDYYDEPDFTPPLRIHATRVPERLTGSSSNLFQGSEPNLLSSSSSGLGGNHRRTSDPTISITLGGSRSRSESPYRQRGGGGPGSRGGGGGGGGSGANSMSNQFDGGSSISSLEDAGFDTDILTDKMGVLELDLKTQQEITHSLNKSLSNLPILAERGTDEMLEDSHAFTDLKRETQGSLSRGGSITTGGEVSSNVLEPLEEIDELDEDGKPGAEKQEKVKITNLEEILEANDDDDDQ